MVNNGQKIGTLGEKALQYLCAQASIIATRTDEDRLGWDYFLEVPALNNQSEPPDKTRSLLRCLVQVKATATRKRSVQVNATSLKSLVDADLPSFIVLFVFQGERPSRCYVRHLDEELIKSTLKFIRQRSFGNHGHKNTAKRLSIQFPASTEIEISGDALSDRLWSYIPEHISSYLYKKDSYRKSVGYDSIPMELVIRSKNPPIIDLIEHDLGLVEKLDVSSLTLQDRRFDVEWKKPLFKFVDGKMSLRSELQLIDNQVTFTFSRHPQDQALTFSAQHHASPFNLWAPVKYQRFRLTGGWFDILVCPFSEQFRQHCESGAAVISGEGAIRVNQKIDPDERYAAAILLKLVRASHYLATEKSLYFTIRFQSQPSIPLEAKLTGFSGYPSMECELDLIESLCNIIEEGEIDFSICLLSINRLLREASEISFFKKVLGNDWRGAKIGGDFFLKNSKNAQDCRKVDNGFIVSVGVISVENYDFIVVAGIIFTEIKLDFYNEKLSAEVSETKIVSVLPLMSEVLPVRQLTRLISNCISDVQPDLIIFDFRPSIKRFHEYLLQLEESIVSS